MTNLTIILLLKERQEYNYRFINHFLENNINYKLIISDGSREQVETNILKLIKKKQNITYIKFPEDKSYELFYKKISNSLKLVKTKYVLFASNDDFLIYKNIDKCLNFLRKNNDYIGAGGTMVSFNLIKNKNKHFKLKNIKTIYDKINLDKESKMARLNTFMNNFSDLPRNSIIRKNVLVQAYKTSSIFFQNNIELKDHFTALFNIIHGKIKVFNSPLVFHQNHFNSNKSEGSQRTNIIKKNIQSKNFINDLIIFDKILTKKLGQKKNYILKLYFEKVVGKVLNQFHIKKEPSVKQMVGLTIKKIKRKLNILDSRSKENSNLEVLNLSNMIENFLISLKEKDEK